ncbi:hypothetical protein [Paracidovorax sp. MALMAid1276]|uniref:hypothetical protein n=1 Tax=Paracidovorax sp. MALMAid1276 TaxID=3411631 RepID=UPI003B9D1D62
MNDFVAGLVRLLLKALVVAMGLVLFASLLVAAMVLALVWALRAGWARLTGRPVTPWVMGVDPRSGFGAAFRSTERWAQGGRGRAPAAAAGAAGTSDEASSHRRTGVLPGAGEVTDVEARDVR